MRRVTLAVATIAVGALGAAPAHARVADNPPRSAQTAERGTTTLTLSGPAARALRASGVRVSVRRPARRRGARLRFPVLGGSLGSRALIEHRGALVFSRRVGGRARRLVFTGIEARLSGRRSSVTGFVNGRKRALLSVRRGGRRPSLNRGRGTATLPPRPVSLARAAATIIRRSLRLRRAGSGRLGRLRVEALLRGNTSPDRLPGEPPFLRRPPGAVDVTGATIKWEPRDSFIRYMNSGTSPGDGSSTSRGATSDPAEKREESSEPLVYSFRYPFARGFYDRASGVAGLYYTGSVTFRYQERGIDFDSKDPEVEINGSSSRAIFRFDGRRDTRYGNKRGVLVNLDLTKAMRTESGNTITYDRIPGKIPAGTASSVFAGFYQPGEDFGFISVSFTTP